MLANATVGLVGTGGIGTNLATTLVAGGPPLRTVAAAGAPNTTGCRRRHSGSHPVTQQPAGEQQPDRTGTGHADDHREGRTARPEGQ